MKKKNKKNSIEEAVEVVNTLKATVDISHATGEDKLVVKTIEASVRRVEKLKKEIIAFKEKLRNKKIDLNQEKETMWDLIRKEKKLLKNKPQKTVKPAKKEKKNKSEEKVEEIK